MIVIEEVTNTNQRKEVTYSDYEDYRIDPNDGSLTIWKAGLEGLAPTEYLTYVKGSFVKVHRS